MELVDVTDATFHLLTSSLNVALPLNRSAMDVTAEVSQSAMSPYVVASPPIHAVTAAATLPCVMQVVQSELMVQVPKLKLGHALRKVEPQAVYTAFLLQPESAVVESKALVNEATLRTFQLARFWLNTVAESKVELSRVEGGSQV